MGDRALIVYILCRPVGATRKECPNAIGLTPYPVLFRPVGTMGKECPDLIAFSFFFIANYFVTLTASKIKYALEREKKVKIKE